MNLKDLKEELGALYVDEMGDYNYEENGKPATSEIKAAYLFHHLNDSIDVIQFLRKCSRANRNRIIEYFGKEGHVEKLIKVLENEIEQW